MINIKNEPITMCMTSSRSERLIH